MQESYDKFEELDTEVIAVFREEKDDGGLKKSLERIKATFPLVSDLDSEKTKAYSDEGFATYLVNKNGKVAAILPGTKKRRPGSKKVLEELRRIAAE